ncbi:MAG: PhnD/SsuA/transferrin family substrate-binding protein, partial [Planctomycetota bacterium]
MSCSALPTAAHAEEQVSFFVVNLDEETRQADRKLRKHLQSELEREADIRIALEDLEYSEVIKRLADWDPKNGVVMARTTPYVQVAAEMLGAELEILATYVSKATNDTTYHSYYVVRKDDDQTKRTPEDVIKFVSDANDRSERVRFTYHSKYSTSSYFLPSLHFRSKRVFHMSEPTDSLHAIKVTQATDDSSSQLVHAVARGDADLAAVWDGTLERFKDVPPEEGEDAVEFVQLPSPIPNDLLVCSRSAPQAFKDGVRRAIRAMDENEISVGDFLHWVDIREATEALGALAGLRWLAREQVAPVTVDVRAGRESNSGTAIMIEAARHAVRLSGTEFVLFHKEFHE